MPVPRGPAWRSGAAPVLVQWLQTSLFVYSPICSLQTSMLVLVSLGLESLFFKGFRQSVSVCECGVCVFN